MRQLSFNQFYFVITLKIFVSSFSKFLHSVEITPKGSSRKAMGVGGLSYQRVIFLAEVDTPLLTMGIVRDHRPEIDKKTE